MKQRLLTAVTITVLLITVIAISIHNKSPLPTLVKSEEQVNPWQQADRQFPSHPEEPLLLYADEQSNKEIYVQDGTILYRSVDSNQGDGTTLLNIDATEGYYWRSGNTLLVAVSIEQSDPNHYLRGEWYAIDIGNSEAVQPSILKLEDAIIDPAKLLTVTIVEDEQLFLLVADLDNERFNEYFYAAGESRLQYVNLEVPRNDGQYYESQYLSLRPQARVDVQYFQKETPYDLANESSIHAYEDDRGTLLVYHSSADNYRVAIRYAETKLVDVALKTDILGNANPFIWTEGAISSMSYPVIGNGTSLQSTAELMSDEWRMVNMRHFYQLDGNILKTIRFENGKGSLYSDPERKTYELPGQAIDDHHGLLTLEMNGVKRYLSVFDLLNGRGVLNELWIEELPITLTSTIGERAKEYWELLNETALPAEILEHIWTNDELPQEIIAAASHPSLSDCILDCDPDFYNVPQVRSIDGVWYMLIGKDFYHVKDGKLSLLGKFPVTLAFTHGEGSNGYTALDYTRIGAEWYVADTYADRIIKLDSKLAVITEYPLPTPSQITVEGGHTLQVKSLQGVTILDTQLMRISDGTDEAIKVQSPTPSEQLFPEISHYIDKKLGTHWVYTGQGQLITYNPTAQEYKTTFIGNLQSGRAIVRIFPYEDEVLVLMDYRLLRFSPDGQWKSTIDFSKGPEDGVYNKTPTGENSYVMDSNNGFIYIVQGVRIVGIDLANDYVYLLFQQDYADIGNLSLYKDRLVFTLEGNPYYNLEESTEFSNELIVIPRGGKIYRYALESGWYSEGLDKQQTNQLRLWSFRDLNNRGWDDINSASIALDRLVFPFGENEITSVTVEQLGATKAQSIQVDPDSMVTIISQLFYLPTNPERMIAPPVTAKSDTIIRIKLHSQNDEYEYEYNFTVNRLHHGQESILMDEGFWRAINRHLNPSSAIADIDRILHADSTQEMSRLHDRIGNWDALSINGKDYDAWVQWLEVEADGTIPYFGAITNTVEAIRWNKDVINLELQIYFITDRFSTKDGVKVGLTKEQVKRILGEANRQSEITWGYLTGDFITFWLYFEDGKVKYMMRSMPV